MSDVLWWNRETALPGTHRFFSFELGQVHSYTFGSEADANASWAKRTSEKQPTTQVYAVGDVDAVGYDLIQKRFLITMSRTVSREGPCKVCSRPNDIGVKTCWLCGIENPCKGG